MKDIKKILFPTDFSAMATMGYKYCLKLAKHLGASVDVLHVYRTDLGVPVPEDKAHKMIEDRKRSAQLKLGAFAHLQKAKSQDLTLGVKINAHAAVGLPEDEIAEYSRANDIDLILMPTKGEHNIIETLFGSVTTATVAKASCPVLVVPESAEFIPIKGIAYATDLSSGNIKNVDAPIYLAKLFGASLNYVHIYSDDRAPDLQSEKLLAMDSQGVDVTFHDLKGKSVQDGMKKFLKMKGIDLLIAYSPPKNFFERLFRLSTTRYMLENISIPLLVMR